MVKKAVKRMAYDCKYISNILLDDLNNQIIFRHAHVDSGTWTGRDAYSFIAQDERHRNLTPHE